MKNRLYLATFSADAIELIKKYIQKDGVLENYHSFNYHINDGILTLNNNIITPYQDIVNA